VNEEINIHSINANIQNVKENVLYYLKENNENRKYQYLRAVKNALRKIANVNPKLSVVCDYGGNEKPYCVWNLTNAADVCDTIILHCITSAEYMKSSSSRRSPEVFSK
jgi:hypothetical protein